MSSENEPPASDPRNRSRNAFALILTKLGRRDHTEQELARALARKEFPGEVIESALDRAKREGLVNDVRLANNLARITAQTGKRGPRRVIATLRQKGIALETAQAATKQAFAASDDAETSLVRFATRLLERARGETLKEKRIKVLRSLLGRGFELSEARKALRLAENALMTENTGNDAAADD